ncbi:MAG: tetratricopeptide repeat protein [Gammaproteobacteria bacterium]|nr:tetratricopeptide repeat protein [Gammaproteobacteria bacterium]
MNAPKRNDPCPCGSGKKYKKCCLAGSSVTAEELYNRGVTLGSRGELDEAMRCYAQALELRPDLAEAHNNLGMIHLSRARLDEAARCFRQALAQRPGYASALFNLAGIRLRQGEYSEAIASCQDLLARNPADIEARIQLGLAHGGRGALDDAVACFEQALALKPDSARAWENLGTARLRQNRTEAAIDCFQKALALKPDSAEALHNLGRARLGQGRIEEAAGCFQATLAVSPDHAYVYSNWLMTQLYRAETTPAQLLEQHRGYAERFEAPLRAHWPRHANTRDPNRRLRVGYVSPDLRRHSVASFIEPVLARHDKSALEVFAYYSHSQQDEVSARLQACVDHWVPCLNLSDEQLAGRISKDGIDILVDLAGHTAGNRLPAFARKPAPVQVSYLGYPATTGLAAMDYRLCSADTDPPGQEAFHTETLYRLPRTLWCYRPPGPRPPAGHDAAARSSNVTFGSMNNLPKVSPQALELWTHILNTAPDARLVMTRVADGTAHAELEARLAARGIAPARLGLHGRLAEGDYQALLRGIDIALDPFPYTGTTTTCETLWTGIPVVTLIGQTSVARSGYALLKTVGLEELAAADTEDYVRLAVELAHDPDRLARLRRELPARFDASPLRDEAAFTRDLEAAYRDMWQRWCAAGAGA